MNSTKLIAIGLGILAISAGATMLHLKLDTVAAGTLLVLGGKLIAWTFPELGAKKVDPS